MTDAARMLDATEEPFEPLVGHPDGYGLYEVVVAGEGPPEVVREYHGRDVIPRAVLLIKGGIDPGDGTASYVHPDRQRTRLVVEDAETAVTCVEGALDMGAFEEVETDE